MNCGHCHKALVPADDLCFFQKRDKFVELMIKFEESIFYEDKFKFINDKRSQYFIICLYCNSKIGTKHCFGPNHADIMAFGQGVVVLGKKSEKKDRWHNLYTNPPYNGIKIRYPHNFYGFPGLTNILTVPTKTTPKAVSINWPNPENISDFNYDDIIMSDVTPRDYQITAYIEALQRDLVLVLPTGYGKTLVASIITARMKALNPSRMVLFIVDRIPLVFQQAESISTDTHLRACPITSEFNTNLKRMQLNQGFYDVVVSTAGAYLALEREVRVSKFCLVIFDECHHATKSHDYVILLEMIAGCNPRPRVLGLTASPPSTKGNPENTKVLLDKFRKVFFNAPICHNLSLDKHAIDDAKIKKQIITEKPVWALCEYLEKLEKELYRLADAINDRSQVELIFKEDWKLNKNRIQLSTMLYQLELNNDILLEQHVKSMKIICDVLEITEMLGITDAHKMLENLDIIKDLKPDKVLSPRVLKLLSILTELPKSSKILVFVKTRRLAHMLTNILKEDQTINKKYSPLKIVGQSGPFGMNWLNEQDGIIDKFRHGNCHLLVSTSVLEEGIDNPDCDVVIRFDGVKSLISFTQSKGRARKWAESKFYIIMSEDERIFTEEIQLHEKLVKKVLTNCYNDNKIPSATTETILSKLADIKQERSPRETDSSIQSSECVVEFYLTGSHQLFKLQDRIADFLFTKYFLKVKLIDLADNNSKWKSKHIFPPGDSLLVLGLQTLSPNIYQRYKLLTMEWGFIINKVSTGIWTRIILPRKSGQQINSKWPLQTISWGNFRDKQIFELMKTYKCDENGTFELFQERCIEISLPTSPQLIVIEIPLTSIHRFILANWTKDDVTLYIPLIHCPTIHTKCGKRLSCDECVYLTDFANSPVVGITLKYDKYNWSRLWTFLHFLAIFPVPVFESRVEIDTHTYEPVQCLMTHPLYLDYKPMQDTLWKLNVLKSCRDICIPQQTFSKILCDIHESNVKEIDDINLTLSQLLSRLSVGITYYFFDLYNTFNDILNSIRVHTHVDTSMSLSNNFRFIETAMVTPATVIPIQPFLAQCNRLYRMFPNERFLNLAFCEEHGEALKNSDVIHRVERILKSGIEIEGVSFYFLVCSGSQLRSKKAIFINIRGTDNVSDRIREIRHQLIGNSKIKNETKYLTRLGLFCTTDYPVCKINEQDTIMLQDLFATNGGNLTDGNGKILKSKAAEIFDAIKLKNNPTTDNTSAIQIRLAGLKGVLTIVDDTDTDLQSTNKQYSIMYRESMKKIEWTDSMLCIVKAGKYNRLFLNTQMLTLLTSLRDSSKLQWDPKPKLKLIFSHALEHNAMLFTDVNTANRQLISHLHNYPKETSKYFDILCEPYFISLLRCIYAHNVNNLSKRFHIPMENGCILMGIPDPIGVLEDGEVYITYEERPSDRLLIRRLTGRMLVYKNPCLHPGDLLTPTAVDKEELHNLHNVIVFPIKGTTSLPACSGGGDLDGDEFAIIWDEDLIPPQTATFPSLNYDQVLKEYTDSVGDSQQNVNKEITVLDANTTDIQDILAQSYCHVISNSLLGIISHYHVAISDMKPDGARDNLSIELAKLASLAVDAPKTNIFPVIPEKAKQLIREKGYPDFMEKTENVSYKSSKLLGEFYQQASAVCFGDINGWESLLSYYSGRNFNQKTPGNIAIDMFKIRGYEDYMKDASIRYFEYQNSIRAIMLSLGIETEAEVVLCLVLKCHPLLIADKSKIIRTLEAATTCLAEEFREKFYRGTTRSDYRSKAAAWYITAYQYQQQQTNDIIFLSFPWLVGEYLCEIVSIYQQPIPIGHNLHTGIGKSAREYISRNSDNIVNVVEGKINLLPKIHSAINKYAFHACRTDETCQVEDIFRIEAYGSVSKYLCELQSDLDVCVTLTEFGMDSIPQSEKFKTLEIAKKRKHLLKSFISPPLGHISSCKTEKFEGFPFLNCKVDSQDERCTEISVDITVESDGVLKAEYILGLYRKTEGVFFGFLWILIHWARHTGILKCRDSENNTCVVITAQFEALVLHIYNKMKCKQDQVVNNEIDSSLYSMLELLRRPSIDNMLGLMLEEFFWLGYKITSNDVHEIVYTWPIAGEPIHVIRESALRRISVLLFQAWHCLVFTRDITKLFERSQLELSFNKRFSSLLSNSLRTSTHFFENILSNNSGAFIHIDVRDRYIHLSAHGTAAAIHKLSNEVSQLESNTALTKSYKSTTSHYILEGSLALIMSNHCINPKVMLNTFDHGLCREHHYRNNKNVLVSAGENTFNNDWNTAGTIKIQSLLCNQLSHFPAKNAEMLKNLKFITRFGYFYVLEGFDSFQSIGSSINLNDFENCLLKGRNNRKFDSVEEDINLLAEYLKDLKIQSSPIQPVQEDPPTSIPPIEDPHGLTNRALGCGFCPGIKLANDIHKLSTKSIFMNSIQQCEFVQLDRCQVITWMVNIQVTLNRSVRIILDEQLQVIDVSESPLVWMLATIVADRKKLDPTKAHDVRLRTESSTPLEKHSGFYDMIFPDGINSPILTVDKKGSPTLTAHLKDKLILLKNYRKVEYYQFENTIAKLTTGIEYCTQNISVGREFCELSLYHNEEELKDAVKCNNDSHQIQTIVANAMKISLKLSETIYQNMN
ncbi:RNA-dependent RNA polymerase 1-like [Oopsacas minuta]|uniref:RNA-directed RNA polymerase n=1 Tax=Oopsacas minuta TaxID=111878 RepID=A0AAV7K3D7_9METZ|nr:RNA-dependent RNA polymerase 1-like [Oopsacas minuta]